MRESSYKAYPFLAAIRPDRADKQAVRIRESGGEQGNPVVNETGEPVYETRQEEFGTLLVLSVCGFQHEQYLILWDVLGIASQWSRP